MIDSLIARDARMRPHTKSILNRRTSVFIFEHEAFWYFYEKWSCAKANTRTLQSKNEDHLQVA
jgi:hypothetical protein